MSNIAGQTGTHYVQLVALTASGNFFPAETDYTAGIIRTDGFQGGAYLCIEKTGTGTATVTPEMNFSGSPTGTWYNSGYQQIDNTAAPVRAVGTFAVGAGATSYVLQILDQAPLMRFVVAVTGTVSIKAYLYMVPI